jgi:hypothetical protein
MSDKKKLLRNILIVSIILVLIDQLLKIYISKDLSIIGQNQSLIGNFLVLYHSSISIPLIVLGINVMIGILVLLLARYYFIKNGKSKLFFYGLNLLTIGFFGRVFDLITVGQIKNDILSGYTLNTVDTLFLNFGLFKTFISLFSVFGYIGLLMLIYVMIYKFNLIKPIFRKK